MRRTFERVPTDPKAVELAKDRLLSGTLEKKIYFAHAQPIYGTEEESRHLSFIRNHFKDASIINPADISEFRIRDMQFYLDIVKECDALVYARFHGAILGGVGLEADYAMDLGREVYEIANGKLERIHVLPEYYDREQTVNLFRQLGLRK